MKTSHFIFTPRSQLNFRRGWSAWLLWLFTLSAFIATADENQRDEEKSSEDLQADLPLVNAEIGAMPSSYFQQASGPGLFSAKLIDSPDSSWWEVLFAKEDQDLLGNFKPHFYDNFRIVANNGAANVIKGRMEKAFRYFNDSNAVLDELELLKKGFPELQIPALHINEPHGGIYEARPQEIKINGTKDINNDDHCASVFIHELTHAFSALAYEYLLPPRKKQAWLGEPFYFMANDQKRYQELWLKGDMRIEQIISDVNELAQLQGKEFKNQETQKRIQKLKKTITPYKQAAEDYQRHPYFSLNALDIFLNYEITDLARKRVGNYKVNDIVNVDTDFTHPSGLSAFGPLKVKKFTVDNGYFKFVLQPQDPLTKFIILYKETLKFISKTSKEKQLEERRAYARQYFPEKLIKFIWKEVDEYDEKIREKVASELADVKLPEGKLGGVKRCELLASRQKAVIKNRRSEDNITIPRSYYSYINSLIYTNQLSEAEALIMSGKLSSSYVHASDYVHTLMGKINFLRGNYATALVYFKKTGGIFDNVSDFYFEDVFTNYCYGVSLLKAGEAPAAVKRLTTVCKRMEADDRIEEPLLALCKRQLARAVEASQNPAPAAVSSVSSGPRN